MGGSQCDVAVVGGGPAGALAATYLVQRGYHVVLLDKQTHPRASVGESLIPDFWKFCDAAGVSRALEDEGFVRKSGGTVGWGDQLYRLSFAEYGYTRPALHVERDRFDEILLRHAATQGAEVREGVTVERFEPPQAGESAGLVWRDGEGGRGRLACRYVLDASGQMSLIARQYQLRVTDPSFRFVAIWGYFREADYIAADGSIRKSHEVREVPPTTFVRSLPFGNGWGWTWHIQLRKQTSVGLIVPLETFREINQGPNSVEEFFRSTCLGLPVLGRLLRGASFVPGSISVMRDYSYRASKLAGPGYFLIGDAAGFIDPIFSIGVVLGMYGARIADWAVDRCLRHPARAAEYQALFAAQLGSRIELSRGLATPGTRETGERESDLAPLMGFFEPRAQALMKAVTTLTGRVGNFEALAAREHRSSPLVCPIHRIADPTCA